MWQMISCCRCGGPTVGEGRYWACVLCGSITTSSGAYEWHPGPAWLTFMVLSQSVGHGPWNSAVIRQCQCGAPLDTHPFRSNHRKAVIYNWVKQYVEPREFEVYWGLLPSWQGNILDLAMVSADVIYKALR